MMIQRFTSLRGCGVFREFTWPKDLPEFGQYNLIYGWNGTGKTTLSRLFRDLELRKAPTMGVVELRVDDRGVHGQDFPLSKLPIRVFNRDFVEETVFRAGGEDIPPIFVIGKENVEKQKEVDGLKAELKTKEDKINAARKTAEQAKENLDKHCIYGAKVIKDTLRATGSAYNEYDKRGYEENSKQLAQKDNAAAYRLNDVDREKLLAQHRATQKPKISEVDYRVPQLHDLADKVAALLKTTVVSETIETLKDDSVLAAWTRQGLGLHKERKSERCLFCEQPLPEDRLVKLEAHFNAEYERLLKGIEDQVKTLELIKQQAAKVTLPHGAQLYDDLATDFNNAKCGVEQALKEVGNFLDALVTALKGKQAKLFESQTLNLSIPSVDVAVVDRLNDVIRRHNQRCDVFHSEQKAARERLALDMIAKSVDEFVRLTNAVRTAKDAIGSIEKEIKSLTDQITQLERDIRQHQLPAEELNNDLKRYLGHSELQLTIKETGYSITRNGEPAQMLSEGETTAIALLYFLKSLEDRDFDKANGIVVLDDPVSSLDANALYLAFGFIRERTQGAGQLFIFTHNFAFFRQVRNWFHHLKGQNKNEINKRPARFYMLDCVEGLNGRCAGIRRLDSLLEQYESEYHYLFACVYRAANTAGETHLEQNYCLPNMARRLLEMFLAFRRPQIGGELWKKLKDVAFDEVKKVRILRFVHTHSHGDTVGEAEHDPSLLGEAKSVLADLMDLIKSEDKRHYEAMVALVTPHHAEVDT